MTGDGRGASLTRSVCYGPWGKGEPPWIGLSAMGPGVGGSSPADIDLSGCELLLLCNDDPCPGPVLFIVPKKRQI